jgi:Holliday junction resolvase RusA-like endonuclease
MPGQPPTWNHMYRWTTKRVNGKEIRIQVKTDEAALYQSQLTMLARAAKPSDFTPKNMVVVRYHMMLGRDLDVDNVMKALNDALAKAIDVNDKKFLPVCTYKGHGDKFPMVIMTVYDNDHWLPAVVPVK